MNPHEEWLFKADRDLRGAKGMLDLELEDLSVYHSQQCAEKALKGYLFYQLQPIPKSHDLGRLFGLCISLDADFFDVETEIKGLQGLDVRFRYPDIDLVPDFATTQEAIDFAEIVLNFIIEKCL